MAVTGMKRDVLCNESKEHYIVSSVQKKEYRKQDQFSSHPTSKEVTTEELVN